MEIKGLTISIDNSLLVKRYRAGRCYACRWAEGTPLESIREQIARREAQFRAYDETVGEFVCYWGGR